MSAALYLPDTNLLSAYAANRDKALVGRVESHAPGMLLSAVVLAEMEYGWRKAGANKRVQRQKALASALAPFVALWLKGGDPRLSFTISAVTLLVAVIVLLRVVGKEAPVAERLPDLGERHPEEGGVEQQPEHGADRELRRMRDDGGEEADRGAHDERGQVERHLVPLHPLRNRSHSSYLHSLQ